MPPPDGQKVPQLEIKSDSGAGLLDARAYWAAVVGPHRLAMTPMESLTLMQTESEEIAKNLGASDSYVFVGVALPFDANVPAVPVVFSQSDKLGKNTSAPYVLTSQMGGGGLSVNGFMQLLLPGEQLFGQIAEGAGLPVRQKIIVAKVQF